MYRIISERYIYSQDVERLEVIFMIDLQEFILVIDFADCSCSIENNYHEFKLKSSMSTHLIDYLENCLDVLSDDEVVAHILNYFTKIYDILQE